MNQELEISCPFCYTQFESWQHGVYQYAVHIQKCLNIDDYKMAEKMARKILSRLVRKAGCELAVKIEEGKVL